ncbi:MAG: DUF922 domain-containing protein [Sphingobacteriales bacterium]|nr:MAG: DUF922 domain-containing protein [Sphingobacteriales bacterium]
MKGLVAVCILLFSVFNCCKAQHHIIGRKEESRTLAWSDFAGIPDPTNNSLAHTYWRVHYWIEDTTMHGDTVSCNFRIHVIFDTSRSWVKQGKGINEALLKHEQGHYDIAKLCGRDLKFRFAALVLYKYDYEQKVKRKFDDVFQKYVDIQQLYDDESNHGLNEEGQQKWNTVFRREFPDG